MSVKYAGMDPDIWTASHIAAVVSASLSLTCSSVIVFFTIREYFQRKKKQKDMPVMRWFPLFLSVGDIFYALFHGGDHLYSLINDYVMTGPVCVWVGSMSVLGFLHAMGWIMATSVFLWLLTRDQILPDLGPYAWKLLVATYTPMLILLLIPYTYSGYGPAGIGGPWCYLRTDTSGRLASALFYNSIFPLVCMIFSGVLYLITALRLLSLTSKAAFTGDGKKIKTAKHKFAMRMSWFIILYMAQWLLYVVITFLLLTKVTLNGVYITITVFLVNLGGVYNLFIYFQIYRNKDKEDGVTNEELDLILNDPVLSEDLIAHAKATYCHENIYFLIAIERLKAENNVKQSLDDIFETFISQGAQYEVNVSFQTRTQAIKGYEALQLGQKQNYLLQTALDILSNMEIEVRHLVKNNVVGEFITLPKTIELLKRRQDQKATLKTFGISENGMASNSKTFDSKNECSSISKDALVV